MKLCVYICYTYMYFIYADVCTLRTLCVCICMYVCMDACMHVCMYVCMDGWMDGWFLCMLPCVCADSRERFTARVWEGDQRVCMCIRVFMVVLWWHLAMVVCLESWVTWHSFPCTSRAGGVSQWRYWCYHGELHGQQGALGAPSQRECTAQCWLGTVQWSPSLRTPLAEGWTPQESQLFNTSSND